MGAHLWEMSWVYREEFAEAFVIFVAFLWGKQNGTKKGRPTSMEFTLLLKNRLHVFFSEFRYFNDCIGYG
jgi:hypothetical protein